VTTAGGPELFAERLARLRERIDRASADPGSVRLVAVSKGFGVDAVREALRAGVTEVGENYANELLAKSDEIASEHAAAPEVLWHFLGAVQRNKVARLAPLVDCWQSLSRLEEGRAIARRRPGATVLVQIDIAGLAGRGGCEPSRAPELVAALADEDLDVAGLMAVGVPGPPDASKPGFALVSSLADRLELPVRSMGMSDDLETALAEGSTMVRVGRALFGDRPAAGRSAR
jgi:pyridoxal phosphate enzyme (YggS family)